MLSIENAQKKQFLKRNITVVIPVKNGEKYIKRKIQSLLDQDYKDFNVVISVNKSSDSTLKQLTDALSKDERFTIFEHKEEISLRRSTLFGLGNVETEFVCLSAIDDFMSPNFISEGLKKLEENKDIIGIKARAIYEPSIHGDKKISFELKGDEVNRLKIFWKNKRISHSLFYGIYKTSILKSFYESFSREIIGDDWAFGLFLSTTGEVIEILSDITFTVNGISRDPRVFELLGLSKMDKYLPYRNLAKSFNAISNGKSFKVRTRITFYALMLIIYNVKRVSLNVLRYLKYSILSLCQK